MRTLSCEMEALVSGVPFLGPVLQCFKPSPWVVFLPLLYRLLPRLGPTSDIRDLHIRSWRWLGWGAHIAILSHWYRRLVRRSIAGLYRILKLSRRVKLIDLDLYCGALGVDVAPLLWKHGGDCIIHWIFSRELRIIVLDNPTFAHHNRSGVWVKNTILPVWVSGAKVNH
jgi:hypothetical protein